MRRWGRDYYVKVLTKFSLKFVFLFFLKNCKANIVGGGSHFSINRKSNMSFAVLAPQNVKNQKLITVIFHHRGE